MVNGKPSDYSQRMELEIPDPGLSMVKAFNHSTQEQKKDLFKVQHVPKEERYLKESKKQKDGGKEKLGGDKILEIGPSQS